MFCTSGCYVIILNSYAQRVRVVHLLVDSTTSAQCVASVIDTISQQKSFVHTGGEDNFTQCGHFFRNVLNAAERERLTDNIAGNLSAAQEFIQTRAIANFAAADANYGRMIKDKIARINRAKTAAGEKQKAAGAKVCPHVKLSPPRVVEKLTGRAKL